MRAVFLELATSRQAVCFESLGLIKGAMNEHGRRFWKQATASWQTSASMAGGMVIASSLHVLMYGFLVPVKDKGLAHVLQGVASRLFVVLILAGIASGQQQAREDPAALAIAKSIYTDAFTALRVARTLDDIRRVADNLDSPDWISVDRFGRSILTRRDADRELESMLALPPERRVTAMDIIWAERDSDRLIVVAWMMPHEVEHVDLEGEFGPKKAVHRLMCGTLIRDVFVNTDNTWLRIRHDKLLPNSTVLAVEGIARILPPLDERHHVKAGN